MEPSVDADAEQIRRRARLCQRFALAIRSDDTVLARLGDSIDPKGTEETALLQIGLQCHPDASLRSDRALRLIVGKDYTNPRVEVIRGRASWVREGYGGSFDPDGTVRAAIIQGPVQAEVRPFPELAESAESADSDHSLARKGTVRWDVEMPSKAGGWASEQLDPEGAELGDALVVLQLSGAYHVHDAKNGLLRDSKFHSVVPEGECVGWVIFTEDGGLTFGAKLLGVMHKRSGDGGDRVVL